MAHPSSFPGLNLRLGSDFTNFAAHAEVNRFAQLAIPRHFHMSFNSMGSFFQTHYEGVKEGRLLLADLSEPWLLTLRVSFIDREAPKHLRQWHTIDVITPFLVEYIDAMGIERLHPDAQALLPEDMRAWLNRSNRTRAPSWMDQIATQLSAQNT